MKTILEKGKWKLIKRLLVIAKGKTCCNLYKTQGKVCNDELHAIKCTSLELWLEHMSEKGLQVLARKSLIPLAKNESLSSCDYCLVGKQYKVSFSRRSKKKLEKLKLVYYDVCGPMNVKTLGGNGYFVTFNDDATKKVWIYLLKSKDQVMQYFLQFHAKVAREIGRKLKFCRSDN